MYVRKTRIGWLLSLAAVCWLALSGCAGGQGGEDGGDGLDGDDGGLVCNSDDQCAEDEFCHGGVCRPEGWCDDSEDCGEGMLCNRMAHECVEAECLEDADCGPRQVCIEGRCWGICEGVECEPGERCNQDTGLCEPMSCTVGSQPCSSDADCSGDLHCDPISAGCTECPTGFFCNFHECFALQMECLDHSYCGSDERCNSETHRCEPFPDTCTSDDDCEPKYCNLYTHTCQDEIFDGSCTSDEECRIVYGEQYYCHPRLGNCVLPLDEGECYDTEDCGDEDLVCNPKDNTCVDRGTICVTDEDCLQSQICFNGSCIYQCENACDTNADCAGQELCRNGCCDMPCYSDYDCLSGETCVSGWCVEQITCVDDGYEDNDTSAAATVLPTPATGTPDDYPGLAACSRDDDWYAVVVPAGHVIMVDIFFSDSLGDVDMYLYDSPNGSSVDSSSSVSDDEMVVGEFVQVNTTYYVKVYGWSGAENTYDMRVTVMESPCADDDVFEDNDTWNTAAQLPLPAFEVPDEYPDLALCDDDWYEIDVPAGVLLRVTIEFEDDLGNLDMKLYEDPDGSYMDSSTGYGDQEVVVAQALVQTTFYVKVYSSGDENSYLMRVEHLQSLCVGDDNLEPNDGEATAVQMDLPDPGPDEYTSLVLCMDNEDWYGFSLQAGDGLRVELDFVDADGDIELELLDPNGETIDSSTSSSDGEEVEMVAAEIDGLYKARVYHYSGDDDVLQDYSMRVSYFPGGVDPSCVDDSFEPNDSSADASPLGMTLTGRVVCGGNTDWYALSLQAGERVEVNASYDLVLGETLVLALFDSDGASLLEEHQGQGGYARVAGSADSVTTFYLRASIDQPEMSSRMVYDLLVTRMPADCDDGVFEPNDEPAAATPVGPGDYAGAVLCDRDPDDEDWYAVDANSGERLFAGADFNPADGSLRLQLFEADGSTLLDAGSGIGAQRRVDSGRVLADTTLLLRVSHSGTLSGHMPYRMSVSLSPPIACADDGMEDNDTPGQAAPLLAGPEQLVLCHVDPDWFGVTLLARHRLLVSAVYDPLSAPLALRLTSADGSQTLAQSSTYSGTEQVDFIHVVDGDLRIEVSIPGAGESDRLGYELSMTIEDPVVCADDAAEPNNTQAEATPLTEPGSGPMVLCPSDTDFFVFNAVRRDRLTFTMVNVGGAGDADLYLFDADGEEIDRANQAGPADESIEYDVWYDGLLVLQVVPKDLLAFDIIDYHLDVVVDSFTPCDDDFLEPNDDTGQATVVTEMDFLPAGADYVLFIDQLEICNPGPVDWYALDLEEGVHVSCAVAFEVGKDIDIYLYAEDGTTLIDSAAGGSNPEMVDFEPDGVPATGRYYLEVRLYSSGTSSSYDLTVTSDTPFICRDQPYDDFEPNEIPAEADARQHLAAGAFEATLCGGEDDWYAVDALAGQTVTLTVTFDAASDIDLYLYDVDAATLVDSSEGLTGTEQVSFTLAQDGPVYALAYFNKHNPDLRAMYGIQVEVTDP